MTRAKRLFIVIANGETLCAKPGMWSDLYNFYLSKGAVFAGRNINDLK